MCLANGMHCVTLLKRYVVIFLDYRETLGGNGVEASSRKDAPWEATSPLLQSRAVQRIVGADVHATTHRASQMLQNNSLQRHFSRTPYTQQYVHTEQIGKQTVKVKQALTEQWCDATYSKPNTAFEREQTGLLSPPGSPGALRPGGAASLQPTASSSLPFSGQDGGLRAAMTDVLLTLQ
jgi:hypothetical protein